jgi:DNA-binding NarL/FixJ family response regulator
VSARISSRLRPCGRVLVVDDDEGVRQLMCSALCMAGFVVDAVGRGEEALEFAETQEFEVAVLDIRLPGISGYGVCRELRRRFGNAVGIVFVSGERVESFDRVAGLLIGADDYLTKPFAPEELVERVRRLRGERANGSRKSPLTSRELDVLRLLAEGLEQHGIAERLVISPKTVATHIEHILAKLGVHSRAQAIALAFREDLLRETA